MGIQTVIKFSPYPFQTGERIYIDGGPRKGDWEVVDVNTKKVTLRCPVSLKEFEWNRFCYVVETETDRNWPSGK